MQRRQDDGILISCDFCGVDWDAYDQTYSNPMVEGHHGSVICLQCLKTALEKMSAAAAEFHCCLCLQDHPAGTNHWRHPAPAALPGLNPLAIACKPCIHQAAGKFSKDPDVKWKWERKYTDQDE